MRTLGRYELRERLGEGGFGTVYRAWDPTLRRDVALKTLRPHITLDDAFRDRFLEEAAALASLRHPHIVTIHDVGEVDRRPYFTMELLCGETLRALLDREGRLSPVQVLPIIGALAEAIDQIHMAGFIHRDV